MRRFRGARKSVNGELNAPTARGNYFSFFLSAGGAGGTLTGGVTASIGLRFAGFVFVAGAGGVAAPAPGAPAPGGKPGGFTSGGGCGSLISTFAFERIS